MRSLAPVVLVLLALPLTRPNIFGDQGSPAGFGLMMGATLLAIAGHRSVPIIGRGTQAARSTLLWLLVSYGWILVRSVAVGSDISLAVHFKSFVLTTGAVMAALLVLSDPKRARALGRSIVWVTVAVAASFVATAALWMAGGVGAGQIGTISDGHTHGFELYFPFTTALGTQVVGEQAWPRLLGYAREPGLMGMWFAFAYFLLPSVTNRRLWLWRGLLVLGLLGTFSVAAAGVFLLVWVATRCFFPSSPAKSPLVGYTRFLAGITGAAVVGWIALYGPLIGLEAKQQRDPYSVAERTAATEAGMQALVESPLFGGGAVDHIGGLNLIASVAQLGLPFVIAISLAVLMPLRTHPARRRLAGSLLVLFLTLLVAQPPLDSTWIYVAAVIAIALTDAELHVSDSRSPAWEGHRPDIELGATARTQSRP